jgi:hypothetical protein
MTFAKQCDDSSEWEGAPNTKRLRASQESEEVKLQDNEGNYGTLPSQRPARNRKPPERFIDLPSQPARKKAKTFPKKAATKPKSTRSPRKSVSRAKRQSQQAVAPKSQPSVDSKQVFEEKKLAIVRLKVPFGTAVPTTPPRRPFLNSHSSDVHSVLSSPPDSVPDQSPVSPLPLPC